MRLFVLTLAVLVTAGGPAHALSTVFRAEITGISSDDLGTGLQVGDLIRGSWGHSDCASQGCRDFYGADENDTQVFYTDLTVGFDLIVGGFQVSSTGFGNDEPVMRNDHTVGSTTFDSYSAFAERTGASVTPDPVFDVDPPALFIDEWFVSMSVSLTDTDASVFENPFIPSKLPALEEFEFADFSLSMTAVYIDANGDEGPAQTFQAVGNIVLLPEPGSGMFVALGLVVFGWRSRRIRTRPGRIEDGDLHGPIGRAH